MDQPLEQAGFGRTYDVDLGSGVPLTLRMQFGLPRPDWAGFLERTSALADGKELGRKAVDVWLEELAAALGEPYRLVGDEHAIVLSARDAETTSLLLRHCRSIRWEIARLLADIVAFDLSQPDIVLVFDRMEHYASYTARYYGEGESAGSGGMCIKGEGVLHIAFPWNRFEWQRTLAHEFAHVAFAEFDLPLWLEEGLVALVEQELAPQELAYGKLAARDLLESRRYWRSHDLTAFWSGEAFFDVEGQEHAYRLADVLIRNLSEGHRRKFGEFVRSATSADQGETAARAALGLTLRQCAETFLGALE